MSAEERIKKLLARADIIVGGTRDHDITVHDARVYDRVLKGGALAIGESFMDGWWGARDVREVVSRLRQGHLYKELVKFDAWPLLIKSWVYNLQNIRRAKRVADVHYDLGNDLFESMLGTHMVYSCVNWDGATSLDEAEERSLEHVCATLGLKPGDRILDIGCGWGSFMKYAAEQYGVSCVGLTISEEQAFLGRERCKGLPVEFVLEDYRTYTDTNRFDHVVSIEMLEAVGPKNYVPYFEMVRKHLKLGGTFFLQTSGSLERTPIPSTWLSKYIFPNGVLPSLPQIKRASDTSFEIENLRNIGPEYETTLMEWWSRFDTAFSTLSKENPVYDERFYRMWKFYLQSCAGLFKAKEAEVWQIQFRAKR